MSLIHNVTFKGEQEAGLAWSSLVCVWLQVRVRPRPIVTLDQMASINTFNQSWVSAQRSSETQSGSPTRPYCNHSPTVTFPANVAVILACPEICRATLSESICTFSLLYSRRLLVFLIKPEVSLNRRDHPWRSNCLSRPLLLSLSHFYLVTPGFINRAFAMHLINN